MIKYKDDSKNNLNLKEIWMFIDIYKFSNQKLFFIWQKRKNYCVFFCFAQYVDIDNAALFMHSCIVS